MTRSVGAAVLVALGLVGAMSVGAQAARTLYSAESSGAIDAMSFTANGGLAPVAGSPYARAGGPLGVAITPDGRDVYVGLASTNQIAGYSVGADGGLTALGGSPFAATATPEGLVVSPDGKWLYAAVAGGIERHAISTGGALSTASTFVSAGSSPFMLAMTADGTKLYESFFGTAQISGFAVGADGALTPLPNSPYAGPSNDTGLALTPDGKYLYALNSFANPGLYGYLITASGGLAQMPGAPFANGPGERNPVITGDGKRLYVTATAGGAGQGIWGYDIGADGTPTTVPGNPFAPASTSGSAMGPGSRRLYAGAAFNGNLYALDIGAGGGLSAVSGSPFATGSSGSDATTIAISPDQPPVAAFTSTAGTEGTPSAFDASATADPDGTVGRYDWDFGDGSSLSDGGAAPSHAFATAGTYHVTLTATDDEGCSTHFVSTGRVALCNGSAVATVTHDVVVPAATPAPQPQPPATGPTPDTTAPTITSARLTATRFAVAKAPTAVSAARRPRLPRGTTLKLALSEPATLTLVVQRRRPGRRSGKSCVKATKALVKHKAKTCVRYTTSGTLTRANVATAASVPFSGRIGKKALAKGAYRFAITAADPAGNRSAIRLVRFAIG